MKYKLIDGKAISESIKLEVKVSVRRLFEECSIIPSLSVILVGDDAASKVYVRNKKRSAIKVGMESHIINFPTFVTSEEVLQQIRILNQDDNCDGILIQMPLPAHLDENEMLCTIDPQKDVDGLHPQNVGLLSMGSASFIPATPAGIKEILLRSGNDPKGKHVVILGRSNIVGKPLSNLLSLKGNGGDATVTLCHSRTDRLKDITQSADILVVAIGIPNFVTSDLVSPGVVAIDVGVNRVEDSTRSRGYRLTGDIDFESVSPKASAITPVPGGVGPMTIAMLLKNTLDAALPKI
ncbi:MAG: methylenetetrahydrofolate dehydrogenase (NADP+) / methenyltetrahydrofolate cyclohydrolase [Chloroflexi bacterium]|jgi:methylenetetrahydrofolate dehydrogenase (NADP+)/methenyltetrahydrofolate cyclohydrolase|nr:MAG: methylenetetrahydrofolate dehydrogenase (NADP+) / methenyltetrahydrofolate cyclohydrolase [Chloroflexota bacterium]